MEKVLDIIPDESNKEKCIIKLEIDGKLKEEKLDYNLNSEKILYYIKKYTSSLDKKIKIIRKNSPMNTFKRKLIARSCMGSGYIIVYLLMAALSREFIALAPVFAISEIMISIVSLLTFVYLEKYVLYINDKEYEKIYAYELEKNKAKSIENNIQKIIENRANIANIKKEQEEIREKVRLKEEQKKQRMIKKQELAEEKQKLEMMRERQMAMIRENSRKNAEFSFGVQTGIRSDYANRFLADMKKTTQEINEITTKINTYEDVARKKGITEKELEKDDYYNELLNKYNVLHGILEYLKNQYEENMTLKEESRRTMNDIRRR